MNSKLVKLKIILWLEYMRINNYTIDENLMVNVDSDVYLNHKKLKKIPIQFGIIKGDFVCHNNFLTSLKGTPHTVIGSFECYKNQLTSLENGPQSVGGRYDCSNNALTSLLGAPNEIKEYFNCSYNKLTTLENSPKIVGEDYFCNNNNLISLKGLTKKLDTLYCQNNQLTDLNHLTQEIVNIDCSNNKIKNLDNLSINYDSFIFHHNPIEKINYQTIKHWEIKNPFIICTHLLSVLNKNNINIKSLSSFVNPTNLRQATIGLIKLNDLKEILKISYENDLFNQILKNQCQKNKVKI